MDGLVPTHHTRFTDTWISGDDTSYGEKGGSVTEEHLILLTVPVVRRLFGLAPWQVVRRAFVLAWSVWRRYHQFKARLSHSRCRRQRYAN
jgi:hypothetical protein